MIRKTLVSAALAMSVWLAPKVAAAYEHQFHLGGAFGAGGAIGSNGAFGLGGRINFDYGITDAVNFMSRVEAIDYPKPGVFVPSAAVGVGYVVDVLRWVPYLGAMAGFADVWTPKCDATKASCHQPKLALEIPAGLDYLVNRRLAIGVTGRYQLLVLNGDAVNSFVGFIRAEYIWGF